MAASHNKRQVRHSKFPVDLRRVANQKRALCIDRSVQNPMYGILILCRDLILRLLSAVSLRNRIPNVRIIFVKRSNVSHSAFDLLRLKCNINAVLRPVFAAISAAAYMCDSIVPASLENPFDQLLGFVLSHHIVFAVFLDCTEHFFICFRPAHIVQLFFVQYAFPLMQIESCVHVDWIPNVQIYRVDSRVCASAFFRVGLRHLLIVCKIAAFSE